jgi:hypothetical protein
MKKRFLVEVNSDSFTEVGADEMRVGSGGAIEFWIADSLQVVYGPRSYISAVEDTDA